MSMLTEVLRMVFRSFATWAGTVILLLVTGHAFRGIFHIKITKKVYDEFDDE